NLASVMAISPELIILDEPTSMLDPISAIEFINCLKRINDDLGTTVIIAEHHLSEIFRLADTVMCLEQGKLTAIDNPEVICKQLKDKKIEYTLPASVRIYNKLHGEGDVPLSVKDGKKFLKKNNVKFDNSKKEIKPNPVLSVKDIWFRYGRNEKDILKGLNLLVNKGEIYSLVGSNGSGKSTLVNVISGVLKPYRGKVKCNLNLAVLPQNPRDLFIKDKLEDDLKVINNYYKELCGKFGITSLLERHPYDLSGGEIQRAAIVKILLNNPDIILLDEPTKGLDSFAKKELGEFLRSLGVTLLVVTHDLEFAAAYSDRCGLLFDGEITSENYTKPFFIENNFYTTSVVKMTKSEAGGAVTVDDIIVES
ncbi:MAG: ATP-binding cassette domain-containing protein, partial [Ruminococcus sp.]|nr:ATP-binding cassette domain-containing protein [Ruminococcus sp.]